MTIWELEEEGFTPKHAELCPAGYLRTGDLVRIHGDDPVVVIAVEPAVDRPAGSALMSITVRPRNGERFGHDGGHCWAKEVYEMQAWHGVWWLRGVHRGPRIKFLR